MTYVVNFAKGVHLHKYVSFEGGERGFGTNGTRGLRRRKSRGVEEDWRPRGDIEGQEIRGDLRGLKSPSGFERHPRS